jgi:hypothetical protein
LLLLLLPLPLLPLLGVGVGVGLSLLPIRLSLRSSLLRQQLGLIRFSLSSRRLGL